MNLIKIQITIFLLSIFIFSCNNETDENKGKFKVTYINNNIDSATLWHRDWCYIINTPNFEVKDTLTIQEGAVVKFSDVGRSITIASNGIITAQGVVFTSIKDDNYGGDSNNDGGSIKPALNDWDGIKVGSKLKSAFSSCIFKYSGGSDTSSTINVWSNCNVEVNNCMFIYNNGGTPNKLQGVINFRYAGNKSVLKNNTFYLNSLPIVINPHFSIDNSNTFINSTNLAENNIYNAIFVDATKSVMDSVIWLESKVAFVIMENSLAIDSGNKLSLGNNVCLKFNKSTGVNLTILASKNLLYNVDGPGVKFTSIFDDTNKGDSNGDGASTTPQIGDWLGFNFGTSTPPNDYPWDNVLFINK